MAGVVGFLVLVIVFCLVLWLFVFAGRLFRRLDRIEKAIRRAKPLSDSPTTWTVDEAINDKNLCTRKVDR